MIAIGLLFVRMLRDCFKSRRQLEAEILVLRQSRTRDLTLLASATVILALHSCQVALVAQVLVRFGAGAGSEALQW
jgi:hypothetical protein